MPPMAITPSLLSNNGCFLGVFHDVRLSRHGRFLSLTHLVR